MRRLPMKRIITVFISLIFISSCDGFIGKKKIEELKQYESPVYVTTQDITAGERSLPKGTAVKIRIRTDKEWVKVYGYPASGDELHSNQVLILYLFKEDFEKNRFNEELFKSKLDERIKKAQ